MASRRDFLQTGGCFALALATALGLSSGLDGLPIRFAEGAGSGDLRTYPLPASDGVHVDWKAQVMLARFQGNLYAFSLACPHQQAVVQWLPQDHRFQCTKHHSRYTPTGVYISGRATRNLDRFALQLNANQVVVNLDHWFRSDQDPAGWAAATVKA